MTARSQAWAGHVSPSGRRTTFVYDAAGQQTASVDPAGARTTSVYDAAGRVQAAVNPLGHRTTYTHDSVGNLTAVQDAKGNRTTSVYDSLNRLESVQDQLGHRTTYSYDADSRQTLILDPRGGRITMAYTSRSQLESIQDQLGRRTTYSYDAAGQTQVRQLPSGDRTTYAYDPAGRPATTLYSDGTRVTLAYDIAGNRTTMQDSTGTTTYVYDALSRLVDTTVPGARRTQHAYNAAGERTKLTEPGGGVRTYTYSPDSEVDVFIDPEAKRTTFQRDAVGRVTTILYQSGVRRLSAFNLAGQATSIVMDRGSAPSFEELLYTYDEVGNPSLIQDAGSGLTTTLTYDAKSRLTRSNAGISRDWEYAYDACDNRVLDTETGVRTWTYDLAGQITTMIFRGELATFTYDQNGSMTGVDEAGWTAAMSYTQERKMSAWSADGSTTTFAYDGDGLLRQEIDPFGTKVILWDGLEYLGSSTSGVQTDSCYSVEGAILAEKGAGERIDLLQDRMGSVIATTNQTGSGRLASARYKPYGGEDLVNGDLGSWRWLGGPGYRFSGLPSTPFGAAFVDYYVRTRRYGSGLGAFTTVDLLWPSEWQYGYVGGSPTSFIDPLGLRPSNPLLDAADRQRTNPWGIPEKPKPKEWWETWGMKQDPSKIIGPRRSLPRSTPPFGNYVLPWPVYDGGRRGIIGGPARVGKLWGYGNWCGQNRPGIGFGFPKPIDCLDGCCRTHDADLGTCTCFGQTGHAQCNFLNCVTKVDCAKSRYPIECAKAQRDIIRIFRGKCADERAKRGKDCSCPCPPLPVVIPPAPPGC